MALDPDDKAGAVGCLTALLAIAVVVGGVYFYQDLKNAATSDSEEPKKPPITKVQAQDPSKKTVVQKAAPVEKMARSVATEDATDPPPADPPKGVTAAVVNLGDVLPDQPPPPPPPPEAETVQAVLDAEPLCYQGRFARRTTSLFSTDGFAITYGLNDRQRDGLTPRLEFLFGEVNGEKTLTYLSLVDPAPRDFPNNHEAVIPRTPDAINAVIARWIVAVANDTCPQKPSAASSGDAPPSTLQP